MNKNDKTLNEQVLIVKNYLNNLDDYNKCGSFWNTLKATDLKDKDEDYINKVDGLIDEWIDNGKVAFYEKYRLK